MTSSKTKVLAIFLLVTIRANCQSVEIEKNNLIENFENITRIEQILTVFDLNQIAAKWTSVHKTLNQKCRNEMMEYLEGVRNRKIWAMKSKLNKFFFP